MRRVGALALIVGISLGLSLNAVPVLAQTESATAEDGKSVDEAPANATVAPNVPIGANLTPPVGITPPTLTMAPRAGVGQSGSSNVSMAPGTLTSGEARVGENAVVAPEAPPSQPTDSAPASSVPSCTDYPTWYDAQLALESSVDPALMSSLDPDGNAIACEEVMYPES